MICLFPPERISHECLICQRSKNKLQLKSYISFVSHMFVTMGFCRCPPLVPFQKTEKPTINLTTSQPTSWTFFVHVFIFELCFFSHTDPDRPKKKLPYLVVSTFKNFKNSQNGWTSSPRFGVKRWPKGARNAQAIGRCFTLRCVVVRFADAWLSWKKPMGSVAPQDINEM